MWDGCGGSMPQRGQEMVCNRVSHRCLLRRLHQERSRGHQMVPREPSDIARIGMLGAKRELLHGGKNPYLHVDAQMITATVTLGNSTLQAVPVTFIEQDEHYILQLLIPSLDAVDEDI